MGSKVTRAAEDSLRGGDECPCNIKSGPASPAALAFTDRWPRYCCYVATWLRAYLVCTVCVGPLCVARQHLSTSDMRTQVETLLLLPFPIFNFALFW